jgi:hypothetical protein
MSTLIPSQSSPHAGKGLLINKSVDSGNRMTYPARRDNESYWRYGEEEQRSRDVKFVA